MSLSGRFAVCLVVVGVSSRAVAFDPHEHKFIADQGASRAVEAMMDSSEFKLLWGEPAGPDAKKWVKFAEPADKVGPIAKTGNGPIPQVAVWAGNAQKGAWFSFGDLVAIYGDLREKVVCDEKSVSCDVAQCSVNKGLPLCEKGEAAVHAHMKVLTAESDPGSRLGVFDDNRCLNDPMCVDFLKGALFNKTHFASEAVLAYKQWHLEALRWVSIAAKNSDKRGLAGALHYEAMAHHSLTDLLSAGHILFDRSKVVEQVTKMDTSVIPIDLVIGALSPGGLQGTGQGKIHNIFNKNGLVVRSLLDLDGSWKGWTAYGDDSLKSGDGRQIAYLSSAVEWSVMSLLNAYVTFREKKGNPAAIDQLYKDLSVAPATFVALKLVPIMYRAPCFPDLPFKPCLDEAKYRWVPHHNLVKQLTGTK